MSQTIPRRTWTEIRWTLQNGKSNVTLEWENFTTYQTFMKPDIRSADLMAEFTIGGSKNILGFGGIISYFELNRISNKNLQNPIQIPKCVTEFERKYTKLTKQVRLVPYEFACLLIRLLLANNIIKRQPFQKTLLFRSEIIVIKQIEFSCSTENITIKNSLHTRLNLFSYVHWKTQELQASMKISKAFAI